MNPPDRRWDGGDASRIEALQVQVHDSEDGGMYVVMYAVCAISGGIVGLVIGLLLG